nr:MAG TPA: hypothetical protein [Caudoviricetes sp.]
MALAVPDSQAVRAAQTGRAGHAADRRHPHHPALFSCAGRQRRRTGSAPQRGAHRRGPSGR